MEVRQGVNPQDFCGYPTERVRDDFLIKGLFQPNELKLVYSMIDRIIIGSATPISPIHLEAGAELRAEYFLERREMGLINIGGKGGVTVDGKVYEIDPRDGLYIGSGAREIVFYSADPHVPAKFYLNSAPVHRSYPTIKIGVADAEATQLGSQTECNVRTLRKYIHPGGVQSCQLVMGMTTLETGSVWNTMPSHTHDRRMEVYLYFQIEDGLVFHLMGDPSETRHIVVRNEEAVISPSWSIHSGVGTRSYSFIWGMVGENQTFADMDIVGMESLR